MASQHTGVVFNRLIFFVFLISLGTLNLVMDFRGLSHARGMEQAQLARENARGNFFETKVIRPKAFKDAEGQVDDGSSVPFTHFSDTYHSPLNPLLLGAVLKLVQGDDFDKWKMVDKQQVYKLDQVVAGFSVLCFLLAIAVSYILISKIFDPKIAGCTAILMMLCNLLWQFSTSGLPQMLMLLLFSLGMLFAYKAIEKQEQGDLPMVPALIAGIFFVLLALTHFLAIWILLAYIIYSSIVFKPRGVVGGATLAIAILCLSFFVYRNYQVTGSSLGAAHLGIYSGIEDLVARHYSEADIPIGVSGMIIRIASTLFTQTSELYLLLGSVFAAPIFFIAILHPFRRNSIARYRWTIMSLWLGAAIGMAVYGLGQKPVHHNQLHILFMPVMTAYGLAFISILWSKLRTVEQNPFLKNFHFVLIVLISAAPLLLALPKQIETATSTGTKGRTHYPFYIPIILNKDLSRYVSEDEIIISDQPWATAWYADKVSVWLPRSVNELKELNEKADELDTPIAGILISPYSHSLNPLQKTIKDYGDLSPLVMNGQIAGVTGTKDKDGRKKNGPSTLRAAVAHSTATPMKWVLKTFPSNVPIGGNLFTYYSKASITPQKR